MAIAAAQRKEWARDSLRGLQATLLPSFETETTSPGRPGLSDAGLRLDVRQTMAHGFSGALCVANRGLGLDADSTLGMVDTVADEADGRLLLGVETFFDQIDDSIRVLQHAEAAGFDYALLGLPLHWHPRDTDAFFQAASRIIGSTDLGIMLLAAEELGLGQFHPSAVPFELYDRLIALPNVMALRVDSTESAVLFECFERYGDQVPVAGRHFGMQSLLAAVYQPRWSGGWMYESLQSPAKPYAVEYFDQLSQGRYDEAMKVYWQLVPAMSTQMRLAAPVTESHAHYWTLWKYYQWSVGGNGGMVRGPNIYQRDFADIRAAYRRIGIEPATDDKQFFDGRASTTS